jgi:hypothetical protein
MPLAGFYNENSGRSYPLVPRSNVVLAPPPPPPPVGTPTPTGLIRNWNDPTVILTPGQWVSVVGAGRGGGHWLSLSPSVSSSSVSGPGAVDYQFPTVPGRQYRISVTWPAAANLSRAARYYFVETDGVGQGYFGPMEAWTDQRVPPSQRVAYGSGWVDLVTYVATRRIMVAGLNDDNVDAAPVIADAFWVEDVTPPVTVAPVLLVPPPEALVDFGCLVGLDAEFDGDTHAVYLHEIRRAGAVFSFDFRSTAPGLLDYALVFSRTLGAAEFTTDYVEATPLGAAPEPQGLLWEGFLVTGLLDSLAVLLPQDGALTATGGPQVEPALVQNLGHGYVRTINLANQDRTHALAPSGCQGSDDPNDYAYVVNATGLAGDIRIKEGYNVTIRQVARTNSLTFAAVQGGGAGEPCTEVPLSATEVSPPDSTLLTGGPACDEVINSINGLSSSLIRLAPGLGVSIGPSPDDPNTLIVNLDRHDMTVCGPVEVIVEELGDAD